MIGYDIDDDAAVQGLNDIADVGGTRTALFADDRASLVAKLAQVLDSVAQGTTTRTVPAFASSTSSVQAQFQFGTGFSVEDSGPWSGVLERRRFLCDGDTLELDEEAVEDDQNDRFHVVLNQRNLSSKPRNLFTVLPSDVDDLDETLIGEGGDVLPTALVPSGGSSATGYELVPFAASNSSLSPAFLGLSSTDLTNRTRIIATVHGETGTTRETKRLGDIYHSSPVVVPPPSVDEPLVVGSEGMNVRSLFAPRMSPAHPMVRKETKHRDR